MTRYLAALTLASVLITLAAIALLGASPSSSSAHALPAGQGTIGRNPPQVALTASYSILGGGGSQAQDLLTYVTNGAQQVVPLTGSPTVYMVDSGTPWSAQNVLNGSTANERWITTQSVAGVIAAPQTVAFSYYHQYAVTFNFNVTNGGVGYTGPPVTFNQLGSGVTSPAPETAWVDASSPYSYAALLPGSSSTERWVSPSTVSGNVSQATTVSARYYHEFLVTSSYSIINGGSPSPPSLSSTAFKTPVVITLTTSAQTTWFDSGASTTFSSTLPGTAKERWIGTVVVQTQSGNVLSTNNNGTVTSAISITPAYYHQVLVTVSFAFVGGSLGGLAPPPFTYQSFGKTTSVNNGTTVWIDGGITYTLPETICCTSSPAMERWELNNSTTGTITSATKISSTYYHQFMENFSYSIVGDLPPSPSGQPPVISYFVAGNTQKLTLLETPQSAWADATSSYSATTTLAASTASERWFALSAIGVIGGPAPLNNVNVGYTQQYLLTIAGGGTPTQWVNAGNTTLSTPGVFGRSQGTGSRVISYQIDSGAVQTPSQPQTILLIPMTMNGPHSIRFQSVIQFQVTLDLGAASALSTITPPTVQGDNYWYDSQSSVSIVLNGAWGRANGAGERITSITATAQAVKHVNGVGPVLAYNTTSIQSPVSVTTTSTPQYEVVLNSDAMAAFASISPQSTFPGDTFWYDSGAAPVSVVLNSVHSRSGGTGVRLTSWELGPGSITKLAQAGTVTVVTKPMTSPQFVNTTSVVQYQVTIDSGGASALATITSPPIPSDTGWYDASSPVGVIMNGFWGRASGMGQRLASYSINGGPPQVVASSGLVSVLNAMSLASPESITTSVVTQYQVTLDGGAASALASITSTPLPQDKYWFDAGTPVTVTLGGVWGRTATTGDRLVSYSVNQGPSTAALSSGPVQALTLSGISGPQSISTKSVAQYRLTSSPVGWVSITNSTLPGDSAGWFDSGTVVKAVYNHDWNQTSTSSRNNVAGYTLDGTARVNVARSGTGNFTVTLTMTGAHTIILASVKQYALTVSGPTKVTATATPPSQTGDSYFDAGSKVTVTVPRVWNTTSRPGMKDMLTSYSLDGGASVAVPPSTSSATFSIPTVAVTQPHLLVLNATAEYEVAFQFFDASGRNSLVPSDVLLGIGNGTVDIKGSSAWLADGTVFSITNVSWEGAGIGPSPPPSYQVKGAPLNVTLDTKVYTASLKVVDLFGLPLSGGQVSMTLANGTTVTGTTKSDGTFTVPMVPLGTFTAKVSSLGSSAQIAGDAASAQQFAQGKVALSLISLSATVAAVAVGATGAGFLLRQIKKRRKR